MKNKNVSIGISYGLIIGLISILFLFWRWSSAENIIQFGLIAVVAYVVVLGCMFYEAYARRKDNGGFIDLKNLFQTLFVSVLVFEIIYALYNYIHLKYIDPEVISRMKLGMEEMLEKAGENVSDADREKTMAQMDQMDEATSFTSIIKSFLISISISGVFALLISIIMRKRKPIFEEIN